MKNEETEIYFYHCAYIGDRILQEGFNIGWQRHLVLIVDPKGGWDHDAHRVHKVVLHYDYLFSVQAQLLIGRVHLRISVKNEVSIEEDISNIVILKLLEIAVQIYFSRKTGLFCYLLRSALRTASAQSPLRSAPLYPIVLSARMSSNRVGIAGFHDRVWTCKISRRASRVGRSNRSSRSKRPGGKTNIFRGNCIDSF